MHVTLWASGGVGVRVCVFSVCVCVMGRVLRDYLRTGEVWRCSLKYTHILGVDLCCDCMFNTAIIQMKMQTHNSILHTKQDVKALKSLLTTRQLPAAFCFALFSSYFYPSIGLLNDMMFLNNVLEL